MRTRWAILCLLLSACAQAAPRTVAIRAATLVDVTDGSLRADQTVLIEGNRIVAVGPGRVVPIPGDADVIDAAGGYLIPGLWDMHVHSVANIALDMPVTSVAAMDWHFPLFLAWGVTAVRNMNDGTGDVSLRLTNSAKRRLKTHELSGPRLLASGPSIDGEPALGSSSAIVRDAAEARAAVDALADSGADFIKVYENLSRDAYFAIMDQARRRGIPVDGHVPFRVTPVEAADAGQRTVEHPEALAAGCSSAADAVRARFAQVLADYDSLPEGEQFLAQFRHYRALYDNRDPAACGPTIEAFRRNGTAVTADLIAYHHVVHAAEILADETSMRLVPRAIRRNWQEGFQSDRAQVFRSILRPIIPLELENVRLFHKAGVTLLAATDVGVPFQVPGLSLHEELVRLVEAGLTPLEALSTATLNPARVLGMADSLGTIEAGKLADLVLLEANPLQDIANTRRIRAVVADGRLYRRADLNRLLAGIEASASVPASSPAQASFPSDSTIRSTLQQIMDSRGIKGIAVGMLDESANRRVIAHGDPGPGALPIDGDSVFEIGSMTKVFTGILLADMVRRGEVELEEPVADLLPPEVRVPARNGKPITLLDLTTHFSGLPFMPAGLAFENHANPFADYTVGRLYESVSSHELQRDPGGTFEYSNYGAALLSHALSLRAATTYAALVRDRILRPLGMTHTSVAFTPWMRDHLVRGHDRAGNPVANWDFPALPGTGGLRSTTNDMLTFAAANLFTDDTDLGLAMRDSRRALRQVGEGVAYPGVPIAFKQGSVGFNWFISRPGERRITWTVGLTGGYSSFLGLDVEARRAVVVLTNTGLDNVDYSGSICWIPRPRCRKPGSPAIIRRRTPQMDRAKALLTVLRRRHFDYREFASRQ